MILKGTAADGTPYSIDSDAITQEDIDSFGKENDCVCCVRCLIPVTDETKQYEDPESPGMIAAYPFDEENELYHPYGKDGWPVEKVLIDKNGSLV